VLLHNKDAVPTLIAMAKQADASLQAEFGLPPGFIVIDTIAACAGYARPGEENDPALLLSVDDRSVPLNRDRRYVLRLWRTQRFVRPRSAARQRLGPPHPSAVWQWITESATTESS
jgi:hypothetical protein